MRGRGGGGVFQKTVSRLQNGFPSPNICDFCEKIICGGRFRNCASFVLLTDRNPAAEFGVWLTHSRGSTAGVAVGWGGVGWGWRQGVRAGQGGGGRRGGGGSGPLPYAGRS